MTEAAEPAQSDEVAVRPGQVWEDTDRRMTGRRLLIMEIVKKASVQYAAVRPVNNPTGRVTRIRLDRFQKRANGYRYYRLMRDVPPNATI